jgi:hypothetical protein
MPKNIRRGRQAKRPSRVRKALAKRRLKRRAA